VTVRVFYDPHRVEQLRVKGIAPRRQIPSPGAIAAATSPQESALRAQGIGPRRQLPAAGATAAATSPQSALDLVEENARLRADNRRLADEIARLTEVLRAQVPHRDRPALDDPVLDDSARRFSLLELDL
jgi:hypothetical protein